MTNREKFREVFNKDIYWSIALEPQILALRSAHIDGIDCMEEWLNSEYIEPDQSMRIGMTEFISWVLKLCDDKPVTISIDNKPYVICTEEYFEKYKKSEDKE